METQKEKTVSGSAEKVELHVGYQVRDFDKLPHSQISKKTFWFKKNFEQVYHHLQTRLKIFFLAPLRLQDADYAETDKQPLR